MTWPYSHVYLISLTASHNICAYAGARIFCICHSALSSTGITTTSFSLTHARLIMPCQQSAVLSDAVIILACVTIRVWQLCLGNDFVSSSCGLVPKCYDPWLSPPLRSVRCMAITWSQYLCPLGQHTRRTLNTWTWNSYNNFLSVVFIFSFLNVLCSTIVVVHEYIAIIRWRIPVWQSG